MSLVNVWIEQNKALVAVDTNGLGLVETGENEEWSKLLTIPHIGAVFAARGQRLTFINLFAQCSFAFNGLTFDHLIESLPSLIKSVISLTPNDMKDMDMTTDVYVIGWSPKQQRISAYQYNINIAEQRWSASEITNCRIAPGGNISSVPVLDTIEAMVDIANKQITYVREEFPGTPIGGRLLIAEITKDSISIQTVSNLG